MGEVREGLGDSESCGEGKVSVLIHCCVSYQLHLLCVKPPQKKTKR